MTNQNGFLRFLVTALIAVPCLGTALPAPDAGCNPAVDPPGAGGCTWNNFYVNTDGTVTAGSSFMNYYVNAGDPQWTFFSTGYNVWRIVDGGHQGDTFSAYDNGILLGTTSSTPVDVNHSCANDPTGPGFDPAACWNDPLMSQGSFMLAPGNHSLSIVWDQMVPGGISTLQWFEVGAAPSPVPEPGTLLLIGSGFIGLALLCGRRRNGKWNEFLKRYSCYLAILLMAGSCVIAGQQVAPSEDVLGYRLGPDDQLKIWALGVEEITDKPVRIDPGGDIDLPMIGKVHAGGLTVEQLKTQLVERFSKEVLKPQVSVEIAEFGSQPVSVMGAVNHPGVHQLRGRKTLMEVVSMAEGLRQDAGPRINITRQIQQGPIPLPSAKTDPTGNYSVAEISVKDLLAGTSPVENILIAPHDVLTVPVAEAVYVMGVVKKPGEVPLKSNASISVLQALASAEGFGPTPSPKDARIIRPIPGTSERKEIPVDLTKIQAGQAEDVAMRPNDILVVPPSAPKKAAARAVEAAIQAATGIAIWGRY